MLRSKSLLTSLIPDCSALRAPAILKTFVIRSFFFEKWLLTHVLADPKFINLRASKLASDFRTFDPGINKNLDKRKKAYYSNVSRNCFKNRKRYREKGSDKEE